MPIATLKTETQAATCGAGPRSRRAGSISNAPRKANSAVKVMPTRRNGKAINHATGHSTSASKASGQHSTSSRHHSSRAIRVFTFAVPVVRRCTRSVNQDVGVDGTPQADCDEMGKGAMNVAALVLSREKLRQYTPKPGVTFSAIFSERAPLLPNQTTRH